MIRRLTVHIFGKVQGVVFRSTAADEARRLGLTGFVRNEANGSVYLEGESEEKALQEFLTWCRHGPKWAQVERIEFEFSQVLRNFKEFVVE